MYDEKIIELQQIYLVKIEVLLYDEKIEDLLEYMGCST
jgi:hypothetical protein